MPVHGAKSATPIGDGGVAMATGARFRQIARGCFSSEPLLAASATMLRRVSPVNGDPLAMRPALPVEIVARCSLSTGPTFAWGVKLYRPYRLEALARNRSGMGVKRGRRRQRPLARVQEPPVHDDMAGEPARAE